MSQYVDVKTENGIQLITLNRPDKKNALLQEMYAVMADSLIAADDDPNIRVTVITGTADSFTSGNDLGDFLNNPAQNDETPVARFIRCLAEIKKPLIAAVNGLAVGVGTTMLMHCDLVYASTNAKFSLPFVNLALVPEASSSYLMPKMLGHQRASELLLLGEPFDAEKAQRYGVINEITSTEDLLPKAMEAAAKIALKAPEAVRLAKALLKNDQEAVLNQMNVESEVFRDRLHSAEAKEAFMAFMERRAPDFSKFN
ncbi:enoyl-CoA hydratase [Sneathiella sp. P13V-1]|uniref:enoyl-CoA hydratase n=1 Tax=Sneathiella sp. P13V-1 TaxID=2697366 RepID=UPI00187B37BB|nr:enoyl-CoA hydratase [Sneathiella sp. P13V-1]MBE7637643.1 enoyl-CoA hydratase [Sneathiella sp. P13V-1]